MEIIVDFTKYKFPKNAFEMTKQQRWSLILSLNQLIKENIGTQL